MAKRISSTAINWAAFREVISKDELPNFLALKAKNDLYIRRVAAYPAELPKIDWNYYRSKIALPGLVDDFQKKYEGLKLPYPTDQGLIAKIDEQEKEMKANLTQIKEEVKKLNEVSAKNLEALRSQIPVSEMTMDEFYHLNPEVRENLFSLEDEKEEKEESGGH